MGRPLQLRGNLAGEIPSELSSLRGITYNRLSVASIVSAPNFAVNANAERPSDQHAAKEPKHRQVTRCLG